MLPKFKWLWVTFLGVAVILTIWLVGGRSDTQTSSQTVSFWPEEGEGALRVGEWNFKQNNTDWRIETNDTSQPADNEVINQLVADLKLIEKAVIVSENKDNFTRLGVTQGAVEIKFKGRTIAVGNLGRMGETTFILADNKVYEVPAVLNKELWTADFWKRKWVVNLPRYQIKKVTVSQDQKKTGYEPDKEGKFKNEKLVDRASNLSSQEYAGSKLDWEKLGTQLTEITTETEGEKISFKVGKSRIGRTDKYWAKMGDDFYLITKEDFEVLTVK